jgi:hypothetical protein
VARHIWVIIYVSKLQPVSASLSSFSTSQSPYLLLSTGKPQQELQHHGHEIEDWYNSDEGIDSNKDTNSTSESSSRDKDYSSKTSKQNRCTK